MIKQTQTIRRLLLTNCLSVSLTILWGWCLVLKGLQNVSLLKPYGYQRVNVEIYPKYDFEDKMLVKNHF